MLLKKKHPYGSMFSRNRKTRWPSSAKALREGCLTLQLCGAEQSAGACPKSLCRGNGQLLGEGCSLNCPAGHNMWGRRQRCSCNCIACIGQSRKRIRGRVRTSRLEIIASASSSTQAPPGLVGCQHKGSDNYFVPPSPAMTHLCTVHLLSIAPAGYLASGGSGPHPDEERNCRNAPAQQDSRRSMP